VAFHQPNCEVTRTFLGFGFNRAPVVDDDGRHGARERAGTVLLRAGKNPIHCEWFNAFGPFELTMGYASEELPRQLIPDAALFHLETDAAGASSRFERGLNFRCFQGNWMNLPDFHQMVPVRVGMVTNFNIGVRTRDNEVGLEFSGYIDVPRAGQYTFYTTSDDGARLCVGDSFLPIEVRGEEAAPTPILVKPGQSLGANEEYHWSVAEGTVRYAVEHPDYIELEMRNRGNQVWIGVADRSGLPRALLMNSRVRVTGICQSTYGPDGQRSFGLMSVASWRDIEVQQPASEVWAAFPVRNIGELQTSAPGDSDENIAHLVGHMRAGRAPGEFMLEDETGNLATEKAELIASCAEGKVETFGTWRRRGTNLSFRCVFAQPWLPEAERQSAAPKVLTTAEQVQRLKRSEAERGLPAHLRGVVTCLWPGENNSAVIQDGTRGVYVGMSSNLEFGPISVGEFWEVEGVTGPGLFAPMVIPERASRVGEGRLPEPVRPTGDQYNNGSLDTQFVEVEGIVTGVRSNVLTMLTRAGKINAEMVDQRPESLEAFENMLVRIRGCLLAVWDPNTHQVKMGEMRIGSATIHADRALLREPSGVPLKTVSELMMFDLQASPFQRVRVAGQIIARRSDEFFLSGGESGGLRFFAQDDGGVKIGDRVEVAGYPELGGPSPVLREAVARKLGEAPLPEAKTLSPEQLLRPENDATRVKIEARLVNARAERDEAVLDLQAGMRSFAARAPGQKRMLQSLRNGSRLELTGVFVGQGGNRSLGRGIDSFELLLRGPAGIRVLARPLWWTLERLLAALGILSVVLAGAMVWVASLRRRVEAQTLIIRQKVEREATLEERARIARELHDSLEQALAGIGLQLGALAGTLRELPADKFRLLEIARAMVRHGQEEARRTVRNLRTLSLERGDLPSALAEMAKDAGNGLPVEIRVKVSGAPAPLAGKVESHLLRIGQEATTNALKHARAATVELQLTYETAAVQLNIRDDGCGFDTEQATPSEAGHFGLLGMRERAEKVGGTLTICSTPGRGTNIRVTVPLRKSLS
jgi:signal transduction histidine kinase